MDYFRKKKNAVEYILMTDGYDGREVVRILSDHLPHQSSILEIGMGPGRDIPILEEFYNVTGSDYSQVFIDMFLENNPDSDVLLLDAISLQTTRKFNALYSNKVLHQISGEDLIKSFDRQYELLTTDGIICHTFWYGDKEIEVKGMKFFYYNEETIQKYINDKFEVLVCSTYREMDLDDSMLLIAKKC